MKKFKTHQAHLEADHTELLPILQSPHLLKAVLGAYLPLPQILFLAGVCAAQGYAQHLPLVPLVLSTYLSVALSSGVYMSRHYFTFQAHALELQHVHYDFVGQKRYPLLMAAFALLLAASLGVEALLFSLCLLTLGAYYGRKGSLWSGSLALAGSASFSLTQVDSSAFQDPLRALSLLVFFALWVLISLNPGIFKILRSASKNW